MRSPRDEFEELLDRHGRWLLLFARGLSAPDPESLVQDAFVRLWLRVEAGVEIADPGAYLATIVRNARSRQARNDRQWQQGGSDWFENLPSPAESEWSAGDVQQLVAQLADEQREVVILKIWGEMTFEQIAAALGIPMNTAASRYRYALANLRAIEGAKP